MGYLGQLSVVSKSHYKCQLSVRFWAICQLSVKILAICQLSVNPIHALLFLCCIGHYLRASWAGLKLFGREIEVYVFHVY